MILIGDGDSLVYSVGFACERLVPEELSTIVYNDRPLILQDENYTGIILASVLKAAMQKVNATSYILYLTSEDGTNFRNQVATIKPYKGNRKKASRPYYYEYLRNLIIKYYDHEVIHGMEADDAMGIKQCECLAKSIPSTIWSKDKDMRMIPGDHLRMGWKEGTVYAEKETIIDPGYLSLVCRGEGKKKKQVLIGGGKLWFCAQMLTGDESVDNIPKVKKNKYGPVAVHKLLHAVTDYKEMISIVWQEYLDTFSKDYTKDQIKQRMFEMAKLLWIRRSMKEKIFLKEWLV